MSKQSNPLQKIITLTSFVEQLDNHVKSYKQLNLQNAEEIIQHVRDLTYPNYIGSNFENLSCLDNAPYFRMVLSTKRNKANFSTPLVRESNGAIIIIEQSDLSVRCRLLTRPAHDCNPKITNYQQVNNSIRNGLYDIYRINDGTTVNISYMNHTKTWIFSSKNGFDWAQVEWRNRINGEIVDEVLKGYPGFSFDKLNPSKTYTIGFRHPAHHPFGTSTDTSACFSQSADLRTGVTSNSESIGLPTQERARVHSQGSKYWQAMQALAKSALDDYIKADAKQPIRPFFGFILRSKECERTKHYSDIIIESSLMNEIRKAIYQAPYIANKVELAEYKANFKNMMFVQVESYLDTKKRALYERLFPQWVSLYTQYDDIVTEGVDQVYQLLSADPTGANWVCSEIPTDIDKFVVELGPIAASVVAVTENDDMITTKKLIRTSLVRTMYVDKFMAIFDPDRQLIIVP